MNLISNEGKYYLYRHIRLDKNEVFYVGIGTKAPTYKRAKDKHCRNTYWKNIIKQTQYEIEILLESNDLSFIKEKEIEFILLYGRKDLSTGTLVNMTDGGDRRSFYNIKGKSVHMYNKEGTYVQTFKSMSEAGRYIGSCSIHISNNVRNKPSSRTVKGFYFRDFKVEKIEIENRKRKLDEHHKECISKKNKGRLKTDTARKKMSETKKKKGKKIIQYSISGDIIKIWEHIYELEISTGINLKSFYNKVNKKKPFKGFFWEYIS